MVLVNSYDHKYKQCIMLSSLYSSTNSMTVIHQVILNEVKNLIILAHEILLPPRRDQAPPVGLRPDSVRRTTSRGGMTDLMNTDSVTDIID